MRNSSRISRTTHATSFEHAIELAETWAEQRRMPSKKVCELMGVEYKTLRRWLIDGTMPLNKLIQFEHLIGCQFISEYLCSFHGKKVVIDIPCGSKCSVTDLAQLQTLLAEVVTCISAFNGGKNGADETVAKINESLSALVYQRENVKRHDTPELEFEGADDE